jgi:AcrR family transcriptional regulator
VRQQIFDAATACFDRYGLRRTTMDDVAEAAGVSRKTVYNYFANKNVLIGEVIAAEAQNVCARALKKLNTRLPPAELIVEAELALMEAARNSTYVSMLLGPEAVNLSADVVDHSERVAEVQRSYWYPILTPLRDAGHLRVDDLEEIVEWLTFMHFVLVARPTTFEGDTKRTRAMLQRYLTPALV